MRQMRSCESGVIRSAAASKGPNTKPAACMVKTSVTIMPRVFLFAYSLMMVELTGWSPPIPTPRMTRKKISHQTFGESAEATAPTASTSTS